VARLLAKTLPRVTVLEIEGVGHMGPVTHPDRINALVERHFDDIGVRSYIPTNA
jgi:pimeloyl-ACP methyl ester carboxylesterase